MADRLSQLDADQVIRRSGVNIADDTSPLGGGLAVNSLGGTLVPEKYDQIDITYVAAGPGAGEVETATYFLDGVQVALLTLSYDVTNRLISVARS